jgi:hypothetical protein
MALNAAQRAELEALGPDTVQGKLMHAGAGRGAVVPGFKSNDFLLGDIEDWLAEKYSEEKRVQDSTLRWSRIAGQMAIVGVIVSVVLGIVGIAVAIWLGK